MTSWKTLGIGAACALTLGTLAFDASAADYEWKLFTAVQQRRQTDPDLS